ncbi:MAG: hypothetical protein IJ618_04690 [Prevotella sp.]|nr:hypothetical protein [Prevotella sp.]
MKRLFLLFLIGICFVVSISAQSFVIYKSDGSFTDISANDVDSIVFAPQAVAGFGNASFANIGIDKLSVKGASTKSGNVINLVAGQSNRAYLEGGFECAHWDMYVRFKCTNGVSFVAGKDNSLFGAWFDIRLENGESKYIFYNNGIGGPYSAAYSGNLGFDLVEGETYMIHLFFDVTDIKTIGFELIGQQNEYFTQTFDTAPCNVYGTPFFYSNYNCVVDAFTISVQSFYDIRNAKCAVWGHSYVDANSLGKGRTNSFTSLLANELGEKLVFNFGLGGDSFAGLLAKMQNELCFVQNTEYGLICIGANDVIRTAEYMIQKVDEIAGVLKDNGITPIFFTICPINMTINQAFRDTNAHIRENYLYVDMEQVFLNVDAVNGSPTTQDIKEELYFDDKVHPNMEGHLLIFNRIKMDCPFLF